MKLKTALALSFWSLLFAISCKNDELNFDTSTAHLKFSKDTVFCDTVYSQTRSETYAVKVYNKENKDVFIPKISLAGGSSSPYRINVDGKSGTEFTNVPLRKNDSLFIFIEIAPVATAKQAIAEDKILFSPTNQHITLLSVVQDAEYFIQTDTNKNILTSDTNWNSNKVKVIYGQLTVAEGKTLNIASDTKVYFTKNSSLKLEKNARLNVYGDLGKEVIFRGDRNETRYDTIPLNWKGIITDSGAKLNINYAKIFGGETGILLNSGTADISNTIIHTFQNYGIMAIASVVTAKDLVMINCGESAMAMVKGGKADFTHCTLANYWRINISLPAFALMVSNEYKNPAGPMEYGAVNLSVKNSIIYGNKDSAVLFKPTAGQSFNYSLESSLLKISDKSGFNFENNPSVANSIKNADPKFINYFTYKMNLQVAKDSPARGKGRLATAQSVPLDILKVSRINNPTIGAYQ